jgi:heme-degrading monooxygenase HmoA
VYARSVTIHALPASIDAGIAYVRNEVMPLLATMDGYVGLSLIVDRGSGRCIATSSWESTQARQSSFKQLAATRERASEVFGGAVEVAEWDIALMHREHTSAPGACARVTWVSGDPSQIDRGIDSFRHAVLPAAEEMNGFCSASLLLDPATGNAVTTTTWDSREAMEASRPAADTLRTKSTSEAGLRVTDVCEFELVEAHLRVPELV